MNLSFIALWHGLERLPFLFSLTVFALAVLLVLCFVALPAGLLLRNEPRALGRWRRERAACDGPLQRVRLWIDCLNTAVGFVTAWLALFMVLMQFTVVIMRYVFAYGSIQMQESIWYMHGLLFMFGAGYTLLHDGHVRLDVFYQRFTKRRKALTDLLGSLLLLLPLCIGTGYLSWSFVLHSWEVTEGSTETSGLPLIYLYKTVILVFALLVGAQSISLALRSAVTLLDTRERR